MARSPNTELEGMNDAQIRELIESARGVISDRFSGMVDEWRSLAHEAGYEITITKIGEEDGRRRRRRTESADADDRRGQVRPKYHNPDNHSEKWSGRGRKPKWVEEILASGRSLDDMLIHRDTADAMTAD
jgi:H-NS histone family